MSGVVGLSGLDEQLWRRLGVDSPRVIADALGVPVGEVYRRSRELLEGVDVLSVEQQRMRLLVDVNRIARDAREAAESVGDERNKAPLYSAALASIKEALRQLERLELRSSGGVERLNALRVQELLRLVDRTVGLAVGVLVERFGLDEGVVRDVFLSALEVAAGEVDGGVV